MDMVVCSVAHFASMTHTHIHAVSTHPLFLSVLCPSGDLTRDFGQGGRRERQRKREAEAQEAERERDTGEKVIVEEGRKELNGLREAE